MLCGGRGSSINTLLHGILERDVRTQDVLGPPSEGTLVVFIYDLEICLVVRSNVDFPRLESLVLTDFDILLC